MKIRVCDGCHCELPRYSHGLIYHLKFPKAWVEDISYPGDVSKTRLELCDGCWDKIFYSLKGDQYSVTHG